jgi:transposase
MSGSKYHKQFDPEYKKEMVRLVEEPCKSPVKVAQDIGVTATSIRRQVKQYGSQGKDSFPGKGKLHPADEEVRKRDKRIRDLEEENAILKKAMSIFAKDGR